MAATAIARSPNCCARPVGWSTTKRVERIWRREGLKVPAKQPKRGRLWLNDGSCIRMRADRLTQVVSFDFVEERTQIPPAQHHRRICPRVPGRFGYRDDSMSSMLLSDLFKFGQGCAGVDRRGRCKDRLHHPRQY